MDSITRAGLQPTLLSLDYALKLKLAPRTNLLQKDFEYVLGQALKYYFFYRYEKRLEDKIEEENRRR